MKISVLVPVFHAEKLLPEALSSVYAQTHPDYELILVLEDPADACVPLCEQAARERSDRVKVVYQEEKGIVPSRRAAVAAASGEICAFLDADDTMEKDCLAAIASRFAGDPGLDILLYNYHVMSGDGRQKTAATAPYADGTVFLGEGKRALYEELVRSWKLNPLWIKAIKTELLQDDPTDFAQFGTSQIADDLILSLHPVTKAARVAYCARPLYNYRRNVSSNTHRTRLDSLPREFNLPMVKLLRSYLPVWGLDTPELRAAFHARQVMALLSVFWRYFRGAKTAAERRAVTDYDWRGELLPETLAALDNPAIGRARCLQLQLLLRKKTGLLRLLDIAGRALSAARRN